MIARHWRGWTLLKDAEAYEALLKSTVLPGLRQFEGFHGGYVFRSDGRISLVRSSSRKRRFSCRASSQLPDTTR